MSVTLAALAVAMASAAQRAQDPVFRARTDLVHLDVSVLDNNRRPVRGLTGRDFIVLEDGQPQAVAVFSAVDVPDTVPSADWTAGVASDVRTNEIDQDPRGRLVAVVIDDAMLPRDPRMVETAKRIARGVIDRISPLDQSAVVFTVGSGGAQAFTNDRARLRAAIDTLTSGYATYGHGWEAPLYLNPPGRWVQSIDSDIGYRAGSLETLRMVAEALAAVPQRRKVLVFISPGIGIDTESAARPRIPQAKEGNVAAMLAANADLMMKLPELFRRLRRANVTVYPIDPAGLGGLESFVTTSALQFRALREATEPLPAGETFIGASRPPRPMDLARYFSVHHADFLQTTASNTGGVAVVNTNDFEPALDRLFQENSSYYLLGFVRSAGQLAGSERRVEVRVNKPGTTVRARSGYLVAKAEAPSTAPGAALEEVMSGPVAGGALPLRVSLAPVATGGGTEAAVTLVVAVRQPAVGVRTKERIDLTTRAYTPDGRPHGPAVTHSAALMLLPGAAGTTEYELLTRISVPAGRYQVRIGAHRHSDNAVGSVYADVDVPDFAAGPVSLSGVWMESSSTPSAVPQDALRELIPVVPTTMRTFGAADRVSAFLRIYQGGTAALAPVDLTVRITDHLNRHIVDAKGTINVDRFDAVTRAADHRFGLPLASLQPGTYLLALEATLAKNTVRRDVKFTVR